MSDHARDQLLSPHAVFRLLRVYQPDEVRSRARALRRRYAQRSGPPPVRGPFVFRPSTDGVRRLLLRMPTVLHSLPSPAALPDENPARRSDRTQHPGARFAYREDVSGACARTTPVRIGEACSVGGNALSIIAGPCSVESAEMIALT